MELEHTPRSFMSERQRLHGAWVELVERFDRHFPLEWFGHLTFADAVHPEQANRRFFLWWRNINREIFGVRYRNRCEGAYCFRASEYQIRGVLHYHILAGGVNCKICRRFRGSLAAQKSPEVILRGKFA